MKERKKTDRPKIGKLETLMRAVVLLALLSTAAMIFYFSSEVGVQSSATSAGVARFVLRLFGVDFDALSAAQISQIQFYVRKAAHFVEYSMLGFFLHLFISFFVQRRFPSFLLSELLGALYAVTDEYHQLLVGTRGAQWKDVGLDSAGVCFGAFLALLILLVHARKCRRSKRSP